VQKKATSLSSPMPNPPCRGISSYFAIKVVKTGIMPLSSMSEPKPRSMLLEIRPPAAARDLNAWHSDTFVNGPAWPELSKAMGLDDGAKSAGSVYVVSVFRAAPGHRDELEKSLAQPGSGAAGNVQLQHLEGGPWHFLTLTRYNSWEDFAKGEKSDSANALKPNGSWLAVRNHSSYHNDTITDRIDP
jgi:heme-degrading monooxygenase HmoA